jgi:hypothetical protein
MARRILCHINWRSNSLQKNQKKDYFRYFTTDASHANSKVVCRSLSPREIVAKIVSVPRMIFKNIRKYQPSENVRVEALPIEA